MLTVLFLWGLGDLVVVHNQNQVQKCPVRDSGLWMLQFLSQINKQYLI